MREFGTTIAHLGAERLQGIDEVLVLGVGGLGHMGVQFIEALSGADIIAVDTKQEALDLAVACGAEYTVNSGDADAAAQIKEITKGRGCDVVLDFVGVDATIALGIASSRIQGDMTVVGAAGGTYAYGLYTAPYELCLRSTYWGSRSELAEVLALAERGDITVTYTKYSIDEGLQVYKDLEAGKLKGRAVIVP